MKNSFREWLARPGCDEREEVTTFAHGAEVVFECHGCGRISEYVIGEAVPIRGFDLAAIADGGTGD